MDDSVTRLALLLFTFIGISSALQVTPNSPCSKICLNDAGVSSISGSDILCNDEEYSKPLGKKFQRCVECLQRSSFGTDDENDQGWLLYNLRFATDWCMYAPDNTQRIGGPCMESATCGGLGSPLDVGTGGRKNSTTFEYCEKNAGSFPREAAVCNDCVQHMPENKYLSNWIVALEAGCSQRPSQKALLGLTGSIFSYESVTISAPLSPDDPKLKPKNENNGLPMETMIGIVVGAIITTVIVIVVVGWKCWKKRKASKLADLNSNCHSRFGAVDIPAPLDGAYSEYKPAPVESLPWDEDYMLKEIREDGRTSEHTQQSSISSSDSTRRLNSQKDQMRTTSKQEPASPDEPSRQTSRLEQEPVMQQVRSEPAPQPRTVLPDSDRNSTQINPLRMNSFQQNRASIASVGVAVTTLEPVDMPTPSLFLPSKFTPTPPRHTPTPPQPIPTPPPSQAQSRTVRSKPSPLNINRESTYLPSGHIQPSPRPGYASSIISSTSTTFSPGVYQSPPPQYQSPVHSTFTQSTQLRPNQRPVAPLPVYNPADYAPRPTNSYHYKSQPQFNSQQRSCFPSPSQQPTRAFHRPQPSAASSSSRFSFAPSSHTTSQPPELEPMAQPKQSILKQKDSPVPIIAIPIPAPKRQTVDLRNLVGMNLKQHISPENGDVPSMPSRSPDVDLPISLDRTESLLAKSSPPFKSLARSLNAEAAMTLPPMEKSPPLGLDEGTIQVQHPDSRASYRGRSTSRPRRESLPRTQGRRESSGSRVRCRSRSRDLDLEGGDGRRKKTFSFGFRGQDTWSAVDSLESGNKSTDVEQWPGKM